MNSDIAHELLAAALLFLAVMVLVNSLDVVDYRVPLVPLVAKIRLMPDPDQSISCGSRYRKMSESL